jgi:hypothetical protein
MASALRSSLQSLTESGADFIVVGDIAAALRGAPLSGFDFSAVVPQTMPVMRAGLIRLLTSVGYGRTYGDLLPCSSVLRISSDLSLRVDSLETVILLKEEQASLVDLAALPVLRATLAEIRRLKSESTTSE